MPIIYLPDRGVVRVSGEDARSFLNGLVTSDMAKVAPGAPRFAALLSPQGKILFDFLIVEALPEDGGGFYLDCPLYLAPDLVRRLTMYRLRAKVECEDLSETLGVGAVVGNTDYDPEEWLAYDDPRVPRLRRPRMIGERAVLAAIGGDAAYYHATRIALGVPEGGKDFAYNECFPHETLMDQLCGVDFDKGCYVGQEVVSRMHHRGTVRNRIVTVIFEGGFAPTEGVEIVAGDKTIGRTGSQAYGRGLAMIRFDRLQDALTEGRKVTAGGIGLKAERQIFATFDVPGDDV